MDIINVWFDKEEVEVETTDNWVSLSSIDDMDELDNVLEYLDTRTDKEAKKLEPVVLKHIEELEGAEDKHRHIKECEEAIGEYG